MLETAPHKLQLQVITPEENDEYNRPIPGTGGESLQDVNTRMWSEWLPNCKNYRLAMNMNIEKYGPPADKPEDTYSELWLPVAHI